MGSRNISVMIAQKKTFAEFFAGIGLMRMGLEEQGWKVAFANDVCPDKYALYRGQFEDADDHFALGDIHQIRAADVPTVTLATASFPCNDLSLAGARAGLRGPESSAFYGFIRILKEMRKRRPRLVLLENVAGFLTSRGGADFHEALLALNGLGYAVDTFLIDASHFVPQSRQRLFVAGDLHAEQGGAEAPLRPAALAKFIAGHPDIRWHLRDLPPLPARSRRLDSVIEDLPDDAPEWWNEPRTAYLLHQMSPRHRILADRMIAAQEWSNGTVFRRVRAGRSMAELRVDGIAGCLRTPRGGSGRQILVKAGCGELRARLLTPRECARLMGADEFKLTGSANDALFGFGDAVCVPAVSWIARHWLNPAMESRPQKQRLYA
jgi:DNA (cytosine-5)-methyltransferase 1